MGIETDVGVFGRDQLMVLAAFRYCLGRSTYIVQDCVDWLIAYWPSFSKNTKTIILNDLSEAFIQDDNLRATGSVHRVLGMNCDRAQWERIRQLSIES